MKNEGMTHSVVSVWDEIIEAEAEKLFKMPEHRGPITTGAQALSIYSEQYPVIQARNTFKAGAQFAEANAQHIPKVAELIEKNKDLISWLMRMSELRWDDATHAPNFKHCVQSLRDTLQALEKGE